MRLTFLSQMEKTEGLQEIDLSSFICAGNCGDYVTAVVIGQAEKSQRNAATLQRNDNKNTFAVEYLGAESGGRGICIH